MTQPVSARGGHFTFLRVEFPPVFEAAAKSERLVYADPRAACLYARRALDLAVVWVLSN
jgi:type I restriction enzyme R subunit